MFGLSLVAAIIESIKAYIGLREQTLRHETLEKQKKLLERLHSSMITSPFMCHRNTIKDDTEFGVYNGLKDFAASLSFDEKINAV